MIEADNFAIDYDASEACDSFEFDSSVFPNCKNPTQLNGTPPPPNRKWRINPRRPLLILPAIFTPKTNILISPNYLDKNINSNDRKLNLFNNKYLVMTMIASLCLIILSMAILLCTLLCPQTTINIVGPALNIIQAQVISGFGLCAGLILGLWQILNNDACYQSAKTENHAATHENTQNSAILRT